MDATQIKALSDRGLIAFIDGELMLSTEAVALLSNLSADELRAVPREDGNALISKSLARKMRRGSNEVMAATGRSNMLEALYQKAVA